MHFMISKSEINYHTLRLVFELQLESVRVSIFKHYFSGRIALAFKNLWLCAMAKEESRLRS